MARSTPNSRDELWKWLERDTGRVVADGERQWLQEEGRVDVGLDPREPDGYRECVDALRRIRKLVKGLVAESNRSSKARAPSRESELRLSGVTTKAEALRAGVLAGLAADDALRSPAVREVRSRLMLNSGQALSPPEVFQLVQSPAAGCLPPEFFHERGIPIAGHRSEIVQHFPHITDDLKVEEDVELLIRWGRKSLRHRTATMGTGSSHLPAQRLFNFPGAGWAPIETKMYRGSALWILAEACDEIAATYHWPVVDAICLMLCGITPDRAPVRTKWRATWGRNGEPLSASILLQVKLFVSGKTVARAYEKARSRLMLAPSPRPMGEKALRLFEFVELRREPDQEKIEWSALMRRWDRRVREEWRYHDRGHFMRDYQRARRLLLEDGVPKSPRFVKRVKAPPPLVGGFE